MINIITHGRGAQGAVTFSQILAVAAGYCNKYCQAFPSFGPERCGAPVEAYTRIDDKPINLRSAIYEPDIAVVLDATLLKIKNITSTLKKQGILIINTNQPVEKLEIKNKQNFKIYTIDATAIALNVLKRNIVNTAMLGAFSKITKIVTLDAVYEGIEKRFKNEKGLIILNKKAVKEVYDQIKS